MITTGSALFLAVLSIVVSVPAADAAKIRKKPPRFPLSTPPAALDASGLVGPTEQAASASAPTGATPSPRKPVSVSEPVPAIPYPTSGLICLYGAEVDPESGDTRCMSPEELDPPLHIVADTRELADRLGMRSDAAVPAPVAGVDEEPDVPVEIEEEPKVRVVSVSFENGGVPGALKSLRAHTEEMAECLTSGGGLRAQSARLKLMFFVGPNLKPTGLIVSSSRNVSSPIVRCIRKVIENTVIGRPSSGATGVTVLIELKNTDQ